jgi:hypothetical protein
MLLELDIAVYIKSSDDLDRAAERIFGVLGSTPQRGSDPEWGGDHYTSSGLGFRAVFFPNDGDMYDPEFDGFEYGLEILSNFWCVELDTVDLEGPLSEYYARELAFELNAETATLILLETDEDGETFEFRAFRRNPQYRADQSPTTPKVFVVEEREVVVPFDEVEEEDEWEEADAEGEESEV